MKKARPISLPVSTAGMFPLKLNFILIKYPRWTNPP